MDDLDKLRKELASAQLYLKNSTPEAKKNEEKEIAYGFFQRICPEASMSIQLREKPDFEVRIQDSFRIGLEITEFYALETKGSPFRQLFSQWQIFSHDLRNRLVDAGYGSLYGSIFFKDFAECHPDKKPKVEFNLTQIGYRQGTVLLTKVGRSIIKSPDPENAEESAGLKSSADFSGNTTVVERQWYNPFLYFKPKIFIQEIMDLLQINGCVSEQFSGHGMELRLADNLQKYPLINKYVEHIFVRQFIENDQQKDGFLWWCAHLASGPIFDPIPGILSCIKKKIEKNYVKENFDELWLLIYAPGRGLDDVCFVDELLHFAPNKAQIFDRIFVWDRFLEDIVQIYPVYYPILCNGNHRHIEVLPECMQLATINFKTNCYRVRS